MLLLLPLQLLSHLQQPSSRFPVCLHTLVLLYARESETHDLYDQSQLPPLTSQWYGHYGCQILCAEVHQYPIKCVFGKGWGGAILLKDYLLNM